MMNGTIRLTLPGGAVSAWWVAPPAVVFDCLRVHAPSQDPIKNDPEQDGGNGQYNEGAPPSPGSGQDNGYEWSQEERRAAAYHMQPHSPATVFWFHCRCNQRRRGRMITAAGHPHRHKTDEQEVVIVRKPGQQSGYGHTADADGQHDTGSQSICQPAGRKLAQTVRHRQRGDEKSGPGIIEAKVLPNHRQQRNGEGIDHVMREVGQHEERKQPRRGKHPTRLLPALRLISHLPNSFVIPLPSPSSISISFRRRFACRFFRMYP